MTSAKRYLIDVTVRGQPPDAVEGEEPVIVATRITVQVPGVMGAEVCAKAIGEEVRKMGVQLVDNFEQLGDSLQRYEECMEEEPRDFSTVHPALRPN